jgi:hypothetical protein
MAPIADRRGDEIGHRHLLWTRLPACQASREPTVRRQKFVGGRHADNVPRRPGGDGSRGGDERADRHDRKPHGFRPPSQYN